MISQADVVTSFLQGNVLWSPKKVKRADRRGRVLRSEYESADRSQHAVNIERLIKPPPPFDEREECVRPVADNDQVQRITSPVPLLIEGTTRQCFQLGAQAWDI